MSPERGWKAHAAGAAGGPDEAEGAMVQETTVFTLTVSERVDRRCGRRGTRYFLPQGAVLRGCRRMAKIPDEGKKPVKWMQRCSSRGCEMRRSGCAGGLVSMPDGQLSTFVTDRAGLTGDYAFNGIRIRERRGVDDATSRGLAADGGAGAGRTKLESGKRPRRFW